MSYKGSRVVELQISCNPVTGHLVAKCEDVKGFIAQGSNMQQLEERVPRLMERLLIANGHEGVKVQWVYDAVPRPQVNITACDLNDEFVAASVVAHAQITYSHAA